MAAGCRIDLDGWQTVFDEVMAGIAGRFGRVETRQTTRAFLLGLLSEIEKKNSWWLAEYAGFAGPRKMQRLLREAVWDADGVRDDVRDLVVAHLGDPDGVPICDETGFLKREPRRSRSNVNTPAPQAGSKTRKLVSSSPTPRRPVAH